MKIIDLTLKQIKGICEQHEECKSCPLNFGCDGDLFTLPCDWTSENMNKEVDVELKENK